MVIFSSKCLTQTFCDALFFLGFTVSCYRAWWTAMRTRWTALGPAWCRGWAQRWPCLFSCCRTSPAHPLLWLQLPPSQLEWRAVGAGAGPWVPICTRSSLICETETLPVILAKSALPVTAPNFHSDSEKPPHTPQKTSLKLLYSLGVTKHIPPLDWKLQKDAPLGNAGTPIELISEFDCCYIVYPTL